MKTLYTSLNEALLSATNLSKDNSFLLPDLLDPIPKIEYEITKNGNKNLITFKSAFIGFKGLMDRDKNPTIDGSVFNCDVDILNSSYSDCFCYINFNNTSIKFYGNEYVNLNFKNKMNNVQIFSEANILLRGDCFIKNSTIKTNFLELYGSLENNQHTLDWVHIESDTVRLNTWKKNCVSHTYLSCKELVIIHSNETVFEPIARFINDIKAEQNNSNVGIIKKSNLLSYMHIWTNFKFKQFPAEVRVVGQKLTYRLTQQKNGSYQYSIIKH